jgi:quercetin dioxygenase-like cupin family protein
VAVELKRDIYGRPESDSVEKANLTEAFASFDEHWSPRLAGELNGQAVKLAKAGGEFVWHRHEDADELFLVFSGALRIELRDSADVTLQEGEFVIVPRGVEHRLVAEDEAEILLFEPPETRNTGNVETEQMRTGRETVD